MIRWWRPALSMGGLNSEKAQGGERKEKREERREKSEEAALAHWLSCTRVKFPEAKSVNRDNTMVVLVANWKSWLKKMHESGAILQVGGGPCNSSLG